MEELDRSEGDIAIGVAVGNELEQHLFVVLEVVAQCCFTDRVDGDLDLAGPEITDRGDLLDVDLLLGESLDVLE